MKIMSSSTFLKSSQWALTQLSVSFAVSPSLAIWDCSQRSACSRMISSGIRTSGHTAYTGSYEVRVKVGLAIVV